MVHINKGCERYGGWVRCPGPEPTGLCLQVATLGWLERKAAAALYDQPPKASVQDALGHFMKVRCQRPDTGNS